MHASLPVISQVSNKHLGLQLKSDSRWPENLNILSTLADQGCAGAAAGRRSRALLFPGRQLRELRASIPGSLSRAQGAEPVLPNHGPRLVGVPHQQLLCQPAFPGLHIHLQGLAMLAETFGYMQLPTPRHVLTGCVPLESRCPFSSRVLRRLEVFKAHVAGCGHADAENQHRGSNKLRETSSVR